MHRKRPTASRQSLKRAAVVVADPDARRSQLVQSFHTSFRRQVGEIASRAACLEDLAETFPGLLFALATGYGTVESRRAAVAHLAAGSRLREAAQALGLPWWMRRLPPQAFNRRLARVPDDPVFSERIINLMPSAQALSGNWLERVLQAHRSCNADFALWVAKHDRFRAPLATDPALPYVAAWAWFARHPDTLGGRLLRRPWSPGMSPRRAFDELTAWRKRVRLSLTLASLNREPWLHDGSALGYQIVELREIGDFIAESEAMDNCLDAFAEKLEAGISHVFSIRQNGVPVADLEIGAHLIDPSLPTIVQLRGPRNKRASPQIWRAAYAWLGGQPLRPTPALVVNSAARRRAWRALWKPYLSILEAADRECFERLAKELDKLRGRRSRSPRARSAAAAMLLPQQAEGTETGADAIR
ncbi:MAG: PcfJ domain-containing protein [Hyphomicrobiaceae bacterium]|nr:PcfJ domain-containing protein [Hyphomicrobiaceae bacterium]